MFGIIVFIVSGRHPRVIYWELYRLDDIGLADGIFVILYGFLLRF